MTSANLGLGSSSNGLFDAKFGVESHKFTTQINHVMVSANLTLGHSMGYPVCYSARRSPKNKSASPAIEDYLMNNDVSMRANKPKPLTPYMASSGNNFSPPDYTGALPPITSSSDLFGSDPPSS